MKSILQHQFKLSEIKTCIIVISSLLGFISIVHAQTPNTKKREDDDTAPVSINRFNHSTKSSLVHSLDRGNPINSKVKTPQVNDTKLYGMTYSGGNNKSGIVFSLDLATSNFTSVKSFRYDKDGFPSGNLVQAKNGKLYGMTTFGGNKNCGVIFSYDPSTAIYRRVRDFDSINGAYPYGSLVEAGDGKLYGMTTYGGTSNAGVIFSFDPSSSSFVKVKEFNGINGAFPYGSLIEASNGKLYGVTGYGGTNGSGVIFSLDPSPGTYTKLIDLNSTSGSNPVSSLLEATKNKLYGMTYRGGVHDFGVIFSYDISSSTYTKLKDFDSTNGAYPNGSLIKGSNQLLYGLTTIGGRESVGVIFSFDPVSLTYNKLKDFDNVNGAYPYGSLFQVQNGKLYGMTRNGGNSGTGVIFSFDPSSSIFKKLLDFDLQNGAYPTGDLVGYKQQSQSVVSFNLVKASTGSNVGTIHEGDIIDLTDLPPGLLNIRANTSPSKVGSVVLQLSGALSNTRTENGPPFMLFGDQNGTIFGYAMQTGDYTLTATPYNNKDGKGENGTPLTIHFKLVYHAVVHSFSLINSQTGKDIQELKSGDVLNLSALPSTKLSIRANTLPDTVGSVLFTLGGKETHEQTENLLPYALFGGLSNYTAWTPEPGNYNLSATPFSAKKGKGAQSTTYSIMFSVVDGLTISQPTTNSAQFRQKLSSNDISRKETAHLTAMPNPFNKQTTIQFSLQNSGYATLEIYDQSGAKIDQLFSGQIEGGRLYEKQFTNKGFSAGVYLLRLSSVKETITQKLVLIH